MIIFISKKRLNKIIDKRIVKLINNLSKGKDKENDELEYPEIIKIKGFNKTSAAEQFEKDTK